MIKKAFVQQGDRTVARVLFCLPDALWIESVHLVGDFNGWDVASHPLQPNREGCPEIAVELDLGRAYQFRYLFDGDRWANDSQADAYVHNPFGSDNFVVVTDPQFKPHHDHTATAREMRPAPHPSAA